MNVFRGSDVLSTGSINPFFVQGEYFAKKGAILMLKHGRIVSIYLICVCVCVCTCAHASCVQFPDNERLYYTWVNRNYQFMMIPRIHLIC